MTGLGLRGLKVDCKGGVNDVRDMTFNMEHKCNDHRRISNADFMDGQCPKQFYNDALIGNSNNKNGKSTLNGNKRFKCCAEYLP